MAKLKCKLHKRRVHVFFTDESSVVHREDGSHCRSRLFFMGETVDLKTGKIFPTKDGITVLDIALYAPLKETVFNA